MTGLDGILHKIRADAQAEAEKITEDAQLECEKIRNKAWEDAKSIEKRERKKLDLSLAKIEENTSAKAEIIKRETILFEKQRLVKKVIDDYYDYLLNLSEEKYIILLNKVLEKLDISGKTLHMNNKDLNNIGSKIKRSGMKISNDPVNIDGGFILSDGQVEENYSFCVLFDSKRQQLSDKIYQIIFDEK